jgi:hypothetical protein
LTFGKNNLRRIPSTTSLFFRFKEKTAEIDESISAAFVINNSPGIVVGERQAGVLFLDVFL